MKEVDGKYFISANELLYDSYVLGRSVLDSGFQPDFIVALWRGGTPVGIAVQEFLAYHEVKADHIAIRTRRYDNQRTNVTHEEILVDQLDYIVDKANAEDSLLLVDDVFDSGLTLQEVIRVLRTKARRNTPGDIRIATVYYKPQQNLTQLTPNYFVHEIDKWIYFPHELSDLTLAEIRAGKGEEIAQLFVGGAKHE